MSLRAKPTASLAPDEKAAHAARSPDILEEFCGHRIEIATGIVTRVERDKIGRAGVVVRHRNVEELDDVIFVGCVGLHSGRFAATSADAAGNLFNLPGRSARDQNVMSFGGKATAKRGTKAGISADSDDDGFSWLAHNRLPLPIKLCNVDNKLAEMSAATHVMVGVARFTEIEAFIDHRLDAMSRDGAIHFGKHLPRADIDPAKRN